MGFQPSQDKAFMKGRGDGQKDTGLVLEAKVFSKTEFPHVILSVAF